MKNISIGYGGAGKSFFGYSIKIFAWETIDDSLLGLHEEKTLQTSCEREKLSCKDSVIRFSILGVIPFITFEIL